MRAANGDDDVLRSGRGYDAIRVDRAGDLDCPRTRASGRPRVERGEPRRHHEVTVRRRARVLAALTVVTFAGACSGHAHHPGGDADGRLLAALTSVVAAIPAGAQVAYVHRNEPLWEACDGRAGTWGWSDVVVQASFVSSEPESAVFAHANKVASKLGWARDSIGAPHGPGALLTWTKAIPPADPVSLTLSHDGSWLLFATATPPGHPVNGC
jgi:hypothetical protein